MLNKAKIEIDASVSPNPGPMRIAYIIRSADTDELAARVGQHVDSIPTGTVNQAEYLALIAALRHAFRLGFDEVEVQTDSQLMQRQVLGHYKTKDLKLARLLREARENLKLFRRADVVWVSRDQNAEADDLSHRTVFEEAYLGETDRGAGRLPKSLFDWQAAQTRQALLRGVGEYPLSRALGIFSMAVRQISEGKTYPNAMLDGQPDWTKPDPRRACRPVTPFPPPTIFTAKVPNESAEVAQSA